MKTKEMMVKSVFTLALVSFLTLASAASGQIVVPVEGGGGSSQGQPYYDAESLARASLLHVTDHYTLDFSGVDNETGNYFQMNMILDNNLWVTNLVVNYTNNIPLDKPLGGIFVPKDGYHSVNMQVTALDNFGQVAAQGQFNTNNLTQGAPINITMIPQFPSTAIQLAKGLDSGSVIVNLTGTTGGYGYWYDQTTGLLTISLFEPSSTEIGYTITDGSGVLLAHGNKLPLFQSAPGADVSTNTVLSLHNAGGYLSMALGSNNYNYANDQSFDCFVTRNGQPVKAKVIAVPDLNNQSKLYFSIYNWGGGTIEVRKWSATGNMEVVPCTVNTDGNGNTWLTSNQYMDKAIITILPAKDNDPSNLIFWVGRSY